MPVCMYQKGQTVEASCFETAEFFFFFGKEGRRGILVCATQHDSKEFFFFVVHVGGFRDRDYLSAMGLAFIHSTLPTSLHA